MRTLREISAGGVIYRRSAGEIEIALIKARNRWRLPKGHVEAGERIEETALREVREETGLQGTVVHRLGDIRYSYRAKIKDGKPVRISKRVYFYLLRYTQGDVHGHDYEVDEARWFPIDEAIYKLSFVTERKMVRRALGLLSAKRVEGPRGQARESSGSRDEQNF